MLPSQCNSTHKLKVIESQNRIVHLCSKESAHTFYPMKASAAVINVLLYPGGQLLIKMILDTSLIFETSNIKKPVSVVSDL